MKLATVIPVLLAVTLCSASVSGQDSGSSDSVEGEAASSTTAVDAPEGADTTGPVDDPDDGTDETEEPSGAEPSPDNGDGEGDDAPIADAIDAFGEVDEEPDADRKPVDYFVDKALEDADVIAEHRSKIEKAEWQKYRADWGWFPKVRGETALSVVPAQADPNNLDNNFDEIGALDVGPVFSQSFAFVIPIYTFDRLSTAIDLAELGLDVEKVRLEDARRDVEFQVRRAYFAVQLSNALGELLADGGKLIKEQLQEMEDARDFGEADFDIEDFRKLQIFDAEVDARRLDNSKLGELARSGVHYFAKVDKDFVVEKFDEDTEPRAIAELETYQAAARVYRPEAQLLDAGARARELQRDLAVSNFFPNIFIAANFRYVGSTEEIALKAVCRQAEPGGECIDTEDLVARPYANPLDVLSFGVALGMRWTFDFPQLYGKYKEATIQTEIVAVQKDRALGAIDLEISKLWTEATQAREKVAIQARRLEAARRWRDQFGLSMEQGGADLEDAVEPLKAYFEARALYLQARFEYLVARAQLAKSVGVRDLSVVVDRKPAKETKAN